MKTRPNSGKAIQNVANAIMTVCIFAAILVAVILLVTAAQAGGSVLLTFVISALIVGLVSFIAWLSTLCLRGYGEIVEFVAEISAHLEKSSASPQQATPAPAGREPFQIENNTLLRFNGAEPRVTVPYGVSAIGDYAFAGCAQVVDVIFPESVRSLKRGAFTHCTGLAEVTLPGGMISIDPAAFAECSRLRKVVIPPSVISISDSAFKDSPVTIYGASGSYAHTFARQNNIPFVEKT